jgi:hypothetical protein
VSCEVFINQPYDYDPEFNQIKSLSKCIEAPHFSYIHDWWHEFSNRLQVITETHSSFYIKIDKKRIENVNNQLRRLRTELRRSGSKRILSEIKELVSELRSLATQTILKVSCYSKKSSKKLFSYTRNLRFIYRQIIRFLFKNLDDESGDVVNLVAFASVGMVLSTNKNLLTNDRR